MDRIEAIRASRAPMGNAERRAVSAPREACCSQDGRRIKLRLDARRCPRGHLPAQRACGRRGWGKGPFPYVPVETLNGVTLPWKMENGVKVFHLVKTYEDPGWYKNPAGTVAYKLK